MGAAWRSIRDSPPRWRVFAIFVVSVLVLGGVFLAFCVDSTCLWVTAEALIQGPGIRIGRPVLPGDYMGIAQKADEEAMIGVVQELTAPEFAGRHAGSEGSRMAAEYIAERFAALGLRPAGSDGFMQPVPVPYAEMTAVPRLVITRVDGTIEDTLVFRRHYGPIWGAYAGDGTASGTLCWLGDGSEAAYQGIDVGGQVVLVSSQANDDVIKRALDHGASGLLAVAEQETQVTRRRTYRQVPLVADTLPVLVLTREAIQRLLLGSSYTVDSLLAMATSTSLGIQVDIQVRMREFGMVQGQNVLGVLPGRHPTLRHEAIILGAHYDHIGLDPNGDLYAGANDDASGVAVLLEIARIWKGAGYRPDRTVLFAAWDGEEKGLLGSTYYVQHPVRPLTDTVGMIQLDMVGLASSGVLVVNGSSGPADGFCVDCYLLASADLVGITTQQTLGAGQSDHDPFLHADIPANLLIWDNAQVPYYHTVDDTWPSLQPERLRQVAIVVAHAAMNLASQVSGPAPN
jgi:hypothetical protein